MQPATWPASVCASRDAAAAGASSPTHSPERDARVGLQSSCGTCFVQNYNKLLSFDSLTHCPSMKSRVRKNGQRICQRSLVELALGFHMIPMPKSSIGKMLQKSNLSIIVCKISSFAHHISLILTADAHIC